MEEGIKEIDLPGREQDHMEKFPETGEGGRAACSLQEEIARVFSGKKQDIRTYSPLTLAYVGDAVYDLIIRTAVVGRANRPANDLHHITVKYVSAPAQAKMVQALSGHFSEEEESVYRRKCKTTHHGKKRQRFGLPEGYRIRGGSGVSVPDRPHGQGAVSGEGRHPAGRTGTHIKRGRKKACRNQEIGRIRKPAAGYKG